jgi:3',5'-cyclic AMP phosphodiesterase CpdA
MSPNLVGFKRDNGTYGAIVPSGTRDPVFFLNYEKIKAAVIKEITDLFPDALKDATYTIIEADAEHPVALLRTVDRDPARLAKRHATEIIRITNLVKPNDSSLFSLDAPDAYEWTLYHLLQNEDVIKNTLFPITYYRANGATWIQEGTERPRYFDIGVSGYTGNLSDRTLSLIADVPPVGEPHGNHRLLDMAIVIRSKDAGINRLTFDIVFNSAADYEAALTSNVFCKSSVAKILKVAPERIVGTFFVDSCNAIKISIDRPNISASLDEHDVFGAQQQSAVEQLSIPVYSEKLAMASSF